MTDPDERLVTVTVRWDDLDNAIGGIGTAHGDRCISSDKCNCYEVMDRLEAALAAVTAQPTADRSRGVPSGPDAGEGEGEPIQVNRRHSPAQAVDHNSHEEGA